MTNFHTCPLCGKHKGRGANHTACSRKLKAIHSFKERKPEHLTSRRIKERLDHGVAFARLIEK